MKRCIKCGVEKPLDMYYHCKAAKDGYKAVCKPCANAVVKAWTQKNPEANKAHKSKYRLTHLEKVRAGARRYAATPPSREQSKQWRLIHIEHVRVVQREYRRAHREKNYKNEKNWRKNNPTAAHARDQRSYQKKKKNRSESAVGTKIQRNIASHYENGATQIL